nr:STAS domain-containing protein [Nocardioides perillae]
MSATRAPDGVLVVTGAVDEAALDAFSEALDDASAQWSAPTAVDVSGVTFFPSSAISRLLAAQHAAERGGVELTVVLPSTSIVARVLRACGLLREFTTREPGAPSGR